MIIQDVWRDGRKITDTLNGVKFTNRNGNIRFIAIFVNQSWRECLLVDRVDADFLLEYEMPNGGVFYQEWTATIEGSFAYVRTINPNRMPVKWRGAITQFYSGTTEQKPSVNLIKKQLDYAKMQAEMLPKAEEFEPDEVTRWLVHNQRRWILHYIEKANNMLERLQE